MTLGDRLPCFEDFVGKTLLCLLPLPKHFLKVCLVAIFGELLKLFLPVPLSAFSGAAKFIEPTFMRFASVASYLCENGFAVPSITCTNEPNRLPHCRPIPL